MEIRDNTKMEQNSCGGFHKWWYHQMVGLFHGKSQSKMDDDLGVPPGLRKPPDILQEDLSALPRLQALLPWPSVPAWAEIQVNLRALGV